MKDWMKFHKITGSPGFKQFYAAFTYLCSIIPDRPYLKMMYRIRTGNRLHLNAPQTFNEKIQIIKLNEKYDNHSYMVDKYEVRRYISEKIGEEYLIPLIGVYEKYEDIDIDSLPEEFVVKCTHDSGSVVVCNGKEDLVNNRTRIEKALKRRYYLSSRDYSYKGIKPRIVIEERMHSSDGGDLRDYKFYCFEGVPTFLYISEGLQDHSTARISFYNMDFSAAPFKRTDYEPLQYAPERPSVYDEMCKVASILSEGLHFVRVDLYEIDGKVYFSELTFAPCGGYMPFDPKEWDKKLGEYLNI